MAFNPRSDRIVVRTPSNRVHAVDSEERDVDVVTRQERLCSGTDGFLATAAYLPTCGEHPQPGVGHQISGYVERIGDNGEPVPVQQQSGELRHRRTAGHPDDPRSVQELEGLPGDAPFLRQILRLS